MPNTALKLPIGYDNFRKIIEKQLDFVDKSLWIKELLDDELIEVSVITRPRRFGKTLNLSMLHHFFAAETYGQSTQGLFDGLKITQAGEQYMQHQGKYPVIFLTLKSVKDDSYENAYRNLCKALSNLYLEYRYLANSDKLSAEEKHIFHTVAAGQANPETIRSALGDLCKYLYLHHGTKCWILIDEYDTPLQSAYSHGYYNKMADFLRGMLGAALKTNPYLNRAVITGILRITKESLFSDLNNLEVYSVLSHQYSQYFGFTEGEVDDILRRSHLQSQAINIRSWYNGYQVGGTIIYNPWSIVNCVKQRGELQPYWVNTSDNQLIRDLLIQSKEDFKTQFECLLRGQAVEQRIDEKIVFADLQQNESAAWSLLLMAGYLKPVAQRRDLDDLHCQLKIPNLEVYTLYRKILKEWLAHGHDSGWYNNFLQHLLTGNVEAFSQDLAHLMEDTVSVHDTAQNPEAFYHGLLVGMTAALYGDKNYETYSNRESGYGRYDYLILCHDPARPTIVLEFKRVRREEQDTTASLLIKLEQAAQTALEQIETQHYLSEAKQRGCKNILKLGLAFCGKRFKLKHKLDNMIN